jgi:hypothetical protein
VSLVRPSPSPLSLSAALLLAVACTRPAATTATPPAGLDDSSSPAKAAWIPDRARLHADLATLASDELRGRYSLSPELGEVARWLAQRHQELGLEPVSGESYMADFSISVGIRPSRPVSLRVVRGTKSTAFAAEDVSPWPQTASGEVRGPAVFVGYAVAAEPAPAAEGAADDARGAAYDDLAGLDLKGKVAVMLLEAPGQPGMVTIFRRLTEEAGAFATAAAPLKQAGDVDGLRALHERTRGRLVAMLQQFLPHADFKDMWPPPADPLQVELGVVELIGPIRRELAKAPGPRFDRRAGFIRTKIERLAQAGAVGVVAVRGPRSFLDADEREVDAFIPLQRDGEALGEPLPLPVVQIKWKAADRLLQVGKRKQKISALQAAIDTTFTPQSAEIPGVELDLSAVVEPVAVQTPNVLARVPGTDLSDELVVLGAHYDHIGTAERGGCSETRKGGVVDGICNGADDNASGTAMLLELARQFQQQRPRRTVIFAHFAGEELGLLGSKALVERPPFALDKVVAMINLDMIGRLGPEGLAIGGLASSDAWMPLLDEVGTGGLSILYEGAVASRSDHASFYKKGLPVLFFFTGTHDDYHAPGDHTDKINLDGMVTIGGLVYGVARAVADGRTIPFKPVPEGGALTPGLPGSDPATVVKRVQAAPSAP